MAISLRTPQGVLTKIADIQAHLTALKLATADWSVSGPPEMWLHFDAILNAEDALRTLAQDIPGEVQDHLKHKKDGFSTEEVFHRRRGKTKNPGDVDMTVMMIRDPDTKTRKTQKAMLKASGDKGDEE